MSLLRNFSPGGSEPEDDEHPTTARPDEAAAPGGGPVPGAARYAFAGSSAGAAPAPAVVPSEVVTERSDLAPGDPAPGDPALDDPAPATAPVPVAGEPDAETTPPDRETLVARDAPTPAFTPHAAETAAPATAPVPPLQATPPVPVPSPRPTGEHAPAARPTAGSAPDLTGSLLGDPAELRARWQRVQGDFVDDPQAAVGDAADLVGQTAEALVAALRQRQRDLRAAWQRGTPDGSPAAADGHSPASMAPGVPDTEHLRLMMQRYRALFNQLCRPS